MAAPSEIADRYRLDRRLGAGGMSTVFLATDTVLERLVAIKLLAEHLAEDEDFVARFRREALAAARLQHPNVVQVFDSGEDPESRRHYIVMEYVDGPSGADILRDEKRLDLEEAVRIVRDACHGLDYAHRAGVVHRDVKPGNLLVASDSHTTKLADFGIAKAAEQTRITQVGSVLGTAAYLSPEQARGEEAGPPSDIYSLGVCAYQFLAGRLPHEYSSLTELALKQQEEVVEPITVHRPEVPPELDRAIRVCLAREPDARYPSTLEMAHAMDSGLRGEVTDATRMLAAHATGIEAATDQTRALDRTEATRATRRRPTTQVPVPPPVYRRDPTGVQPAAEPSKGAKRAKRNRRLGTLFALLAVAAAIAAVIVALTSSSSNNGPQPVNQGDVQQQIDGVKQFLRENTR
jgi:eukaryotic-like serine/threonine-protein kinase